MQFNILRFQLSGGNKRIFSVYYVGVNDAAELIERTIVLDLDSSLVYCNCWKACPMSRNDLGVKFYHIGTSKQEEEGKVWNTHFNNLKLYE
jgi:hypothetical protein